MIAAVAAIVGLFAANHTTPNPQPYIPEPTLATPELVALVSKGDGHHLFIELKNTDGYGNPEFCVWNTEDSAGEKRYYYPMRSDGCWTEYIPLSELGTAGYYRVEAYAPVNGERQLIAQTDVLVEVITLTDLRLSVSQENMTIAIAMDKVAGYEDISFGVWGNENDGNDLTWHQAEQKNGEWVYQADLLEHNELGLYFVHAYGWKNGEKILLAQGQIYVDAIVQPELSAWEDSNMHDLQILLEKAGGNTRVTVAVWRESEGEAGIQWFEANPGTDGSWTCSVDLRRFAGPDNFIVQLYGKKNEKSDPEKLIASVVVTVEHILHYNIFSAVSTENQTIWVGVTCPAENVRFGVWGEDYGAEDLIFYDGVRQANGNWECVVDLSNHLGSGAYFVHAYGTVNGQDTLLAATRVVLE